MTLARSAMPGVVGTPSAAGVPCSGRRGCEALGGELEAVHRLDHGQAHEARSVLAVEVAGLTSNPAVAAR